MRNDQQETLDSLWWLSLNDASDEFYAEMQEWWELNYNKSDREWQDLSYWEVANVAMMFLAVKDEWKAAELTEKDMYAEWVGSR